MTQCETVIATISSFSYVNTTTQSFFSTFTPASIINTCLPEYVPSPPLAYGFGLGPFGGPSNPFGGTP
jgi:hypothetical protein